jgi:hypothetical protein
VKRQEPVLDEVEQDQKPKKPKSRKVAKYTTSDSEQGEDKSSVLLKSKPKVSKNKQPDGKAIPKGTSTLSSSTKGRKKVADSDAEDAPSRKRGKTFLSAVRISRIAVSQVVLTSRVGLCQL